MESSRWLVFVFTKFTLLSVLRALTTHSPGLHACDLGACAGVSRGLSSGFHPRPTKPSRFLGGCGNAESCRESLVSLSVENTSLAALGSRGDQSRLDQGR